MAAKVISGVYRIINNINQKLYIGSAININRRWLEHLSELRLNAHDNPHLQNSWNKHGTDSFTFLIQEICEVSQLLEREQYWMDMLNPQYNICKYAYSSLGLKHSAETKLKMPINRLGKKHTKEAKLKMSQSWYIREAVNHRALFERAKTHCPQGHLLLGDNLVQTVLRKKGWRKCRTCHNRRSTDYNHKKRDQKVLKCQQK